ncbi:MAG: phage head closure protein [Sphingomonadales bacterium]
MIENFRHKVVLQTASSVQGPGGHITKTWNTLATVAAAIEPLRGAQQLAAMKLEHPLTHRITVRYQPGLTDARRILFGARIFEVHAAINDGERSRFIIFKAEEQT